MRSAVVLVSVCAVLSCLASDREIVVWPGSRMALETVRGAFPGQHVDVADGVLDISTSKRLSVVLSNLTDHAVSVLLSVKNASLQGRELGGSVTLAPRARGEITCDLSLEPWALDRPLSFVGMSGYPSAPGAKTSCFDLKTVKSFHLFRFEGDDPQAFKVVSISLHGMANRTRRVYAAETFMPFVDAYGQFMHGEWPGKVHSDADLSAQAAEEGRWLNEVSDPFDNANGFGGWKNGPRLRATGFFRVEKVNGKWWFVDPEGCLFWSSGIDCVQPSGAESGVGGREAYFSWVPDPKDPEFGCFTGIADWRASRGFYSKKENVPYRTVDFSGINMRRKYGPCWQKTGRELAHRRMRAWGVNTIGNWSDTGICMMSRTPYVVCLDTRGTPRIKGSDGWWGPLPDAATKEFQDILRQRAKAAALRMKDDPWCLGVFVDNEQSWCNLPNLRQVAESYYSTVARIIREELPHHLYLGDRIGWGDPDVYRIASRYCDVVSVNIYSRSPDRDLPEGSEDRPMIVGEFHFGALDRGLFHPGLSPTKDQRERADCYRSFMRICAQRSRIVGAHWFQWKDQPLTGRADGECYQVGFLNVADAPYVELVEASRGFASEMYKIRYGQN